jgi:hypothetical protein
VLPHAVRLSSDANSTARQNATFCLGILGQFGGPAAIDVMQTLLTALQPRLADEEASVCDNGVASLARLVLAFGATLPALGLSNKEIAQSLTISVETVKEHVQNILRKIAVSDRTQAAVWAVRRGLV